jgi:hypothetical protein
MVGFGVCPWQGGAVADDQGCRPWASRLGWRSFEGLRFFNLPFFPGELERHYLSHDQGNAEAEAADCTAWSRVRLSRLYAYATAHTPPIEQMKSEYDKLCPPSSLTLPTKSACLLHAP